MRGLSCRPNTIVPSSGSWALAETSGPFFPTNFRHRKLANRFRRQPKKSPIGRDQRINLLVDPGFVKISKWLTQRYGTGIGRADL
jgi:hypothetical protein